jgi:outer membrane protein TolC
VKTVWVWCVVSLLGTAAQAESLKQLLEAADQANVDRRISLEQRQKAASELTAAWTSLLPSLMAQGGWTRNQFQTEIPANLFGPGSPAIVITPKDQLDLIVRAELPLIDTTRWFRTAAASAADDAAGYRDEMMRDVVKRQVSATYYSLAAALAVRESAKKSLSVAQAQQNLQEIRARVGSATELEVLRAKAEVQRNKQTVADTEMLVANMRRALRTLTGVTVESGAVLPADKLTQVAPLDDLESKTDELPAVRAADRDATAAERFAWVSRLAAVPMVTANFTERVSNATGFSGQPNSWTAGIGLLWRFDGPTLFNMSAQGHGAAVARLAHERQRLTSRDQLHSDWQRLTAAIEKVTAARAQVESAQRAAQVARDRYDAGASTQFEVIQSERDLFGAEVNQIQARTELASSHVGLRLSANLPLELE